MKKLDFKINSRLFVRLFVSYMACILVPLAVFVTIIIIYAQTNIHQNAVKTYSTIQEANIQNFEDTIREIYNTAFRLSTESAVKNLNSNTYQDKIERNFEIKDVMSSLRISGSRIFQTNSADIAVYFDKNSVVVTPDGKYSYENYMKDILSAEGAYTQLAFFQSYFDVNGTPLVLSSSNGQKLTYIVSMASFSNNSSTYVIATIPIFETLSSGLEDVPWVIRTEDGILLTNQPVVESEETLTLLPQTENRLYSKKYYQFTQKIPSVPLTCTMFLDSQRVQGELWNIYFILILAVFAVAALGGTVSWYLSKYNYKPIDRILHIIDPYRPQTPPDDPHPRGRNEEEQISDTIKTLIANNSQLQTQIREKLPSLQQSFLSRLLKDPASEGKQPEDMDFYGLDFSLPSFAVVQGSFQGTSALASDVVRSLVSTVISQRSPSCNIYTAEDVNNGISIIINFDPSKEPLEEIVKRLRRMLPTYILLGCSMASSQGAADLHRCYTQAVDALGGCFAEESLLSFYRETGRKKFFSLTVEQEAALSGYIKERRPDLVHTMLTNLLEESTKYGQSSVKFLKVFYYDLLALLLRTASGLGLNPADLWPEEQEEKFSRASGEARIRALEDLAEKIYTGMGASATAHTNTMQEKLLTYIHENYSNPDLSLNMIARTFNISSQYLSSFFKSHMGQNYIEYITQYRLRHALELLKNTDDSVQEIAHKVGYTDAGHFIRMFKKYYSLTPGQYRSNTET